MMNTQLWTRIAVLAAALAVAAPAIHAQTYPNKPIRVVLPYPPGGGLDTIARPLARDLTERLGQQVIVDNRGGASGNIGMELAAKSPPDGYTIVMALTAQLAVNPSLFRKLPYDPVKDFVPITLMANGPYLMVVHPSLPVKSVKEFIALARRHPGQIVYASSGNGSGGHLAAVLLESMAHIKMLHVPYKGGGQALVDLLAGNVQMLFAPYASSKGHIQSGRIRALAVTTAKRPAAIPDLPTLAEAGVPGYDSGVWYAMLAPAGTPRAIVERLNRETRRRSETAGLREVSFQFSHRSGGQHARGTGNVHQIRNREIRQSHQGSGRACRLSVRSASDRRRWIIERKQLGLAIVGSGRIGTLRARLAAGHPAVRFIAVSDQDPAKARDLAQKVGAQFHSADNDEVIGRPEVNAVVVSTSEGEHMAPLLKAIELGKPVLVEKPIALTLADADRVIQAAEKSPAPTCASATAGATRSAT